MIPSVRPAETVGAALERGRRELARCGVPEPLRSARFLLAHALGVEAAELTRRSADPLGAAGERYDTLLARRARREPLQYLLGEWEFWGLALEVTPQALIPRPETEHLVERALAELGASPARFADAGTGTGCIALALLSERPGWRGLAIDRSAAALELARRNAGRLGTLDRLLFVLGDLLAAARPGCLDLVVANPPYVTEVEHATLAPELAHEPRAALVAGPIGTECHAALARQAAVVLRPGGLLALEIGAGQETAVTAILGETAAFGPPLVTPDLAGIPRVVTARRR